MIVISGMNAEMRNICGVDQHMKEMFMIKLYDNCNRIFCFIIIQIMRHFYGLFQFMMLIFMD